MTRHHLVPLLLLVIAWPVTGIAEIFKCVAENGELTFSQTPCHGDTVTMRASRGHSEDDALNCKYAHRFALAVARDMKSGADSSTQFRQYGGLNALSRASVGLISYVYQYRSNDDVPVARIAALSAAKCRARSFGDVSCDQLPVSFTNRLGGCRSSAAHADKTHLPMDAPPPNAYETPRDVLKKNQAANRDAMAKFKQQREECRDKVRAQIDRINSQMRSGYSASQGISLRSKRRDLEQRLREC